MVRFTVLLRLHLTTAKIKATTTAKRELVANRGAGARAGSVLTPQYMYVC